MRVKSQRFDMPWHVATLNEDRAQYIVLLHFLILLWGLDLSCPWVFRIDKMSYLKKRNKKYFKFVFEYISNILLIF